MKLVSDSDELVEVQEGGIKTDSGRTTESASLLFSGFFAVLFSVILYKIKSASRRNYVYCD